jgi:hypothetical protein
VVGRAEKVRCARVLQTSTCSAIVVPSQIIDPEQICCSLFKTLGKHQILVAARVIVDTTDHFKAEFRKSQVLEVVGLQHKLLSSGILAVAKPSLATVMRESRSYAGIASIRLNPVASGSSKVRFNLKLAAASSA